MARYDSRNFFWCADSHVATVGQKGLHDRMLHSTVDENLWFWPGITF